MAQAAVQKLCEDLFEREVVGCFAASPVADPVLASVYVANGFRRTGVLRRPRRSMRTAASTETPVTRE